MKIGDVLLEPPLILAPMEGVTDVYFRRLIRSIGGAGLTVTEFVAAEGLRRDVPRAKAMADFDPEEHPVAIQIYGRKPETMGEAARLVQDLGADIVDLNMGCPSKKVCAHSGGSSLMREPELAREIVAEMRRAVSIPLSVKMRAGWDHKMRNAPELARMCQEEGADAVAVHWRTRSDGYKGERTLDVIAAVKDRVDIPVSANGDIVDVATAMDTLSQTGCDGLMIGRGAVRNPWIFREIEAALAKKPPVPVGALERCTVLLEYFETVRTHFRHEHAALGRVKKIARYFTHGVPGGAILRQSIFHSTSLDEASDHVRQYFERLDELEISTTIATA